MRTIVGDFMTMALKTDGKVGYGRGPGPQDYVRAAVLMELVVTRKIGGTERDPGGELIFKVIDSAPTGDQTLDAALAYLGEVLPSRIGDAMEGMHDYTKQIVESLVAAGVFRCEERRKLGFRAHSYELADPRERSAIRARLHPMPADARSAAVGMLLDLGDQQTGWMPNFREDLTNGDGQSIGAEVTECLAEVMSGLASWVGL